MTIVDSGGSKGARRAIASSVSLHYKIIAISLFNALIYLYITADIATVYHILGIVHGRKSS